MLVLLIVFIVTLPVARHAVTVNLPQASSQPGRDQPETVRLSVDAGRYHWNQGAARRRGAAGAPGQQRPGSPSPSCRSMATGRCATSASPRP